MYTDAEGVRKREMEAIAGPNEFAEFYARLKILKDAHRRNPDEVSSFDVPKQFCITCGFSPVLSSFTSLILAFHLVSVELKHQKIQLAEPLSMEFQKMHEEIADPEREETDMVQFTDEEGYGR